MFNSYEYSYSNLDVFLRGRSVAGLRGIKYKASQDKEVIHARGNEPHSIQRGNKSYEGEITIVQSELEALIREAGKGKDVTDLRALSFIVTYRPEEGLQLVTDEIQFAEIKEFEKGMKQGDKFMEITLPFIALKINFNI